MSARREGWFAHCDDCGFGFEIIQLEAEPVPDPDESDNGKIDCPGCDRSIRGWSQI